MKRQKELAQTADCKDAICPVCTKARAVERYSPFCSGRCADIDLHRWLSESYRIPDNDRSSEESFHSERPEDL